MYVCISLKMPHLSYYGARNHFKCCGLKYQLFVFFLISELTAFAGGVLVYCQLVLGCTGRLKSASLEAEG